MSSSSIQLLWEETRANALLSSRRALYIGYKLTTTQLNGQKPWGQQARGYVYFCCEEVRSRACGCTVMTDCRQVRVRASARKAYM